VIVSIVAVTVALVTRFRARFFAGFYFFGAPIGTGCGCFKCWVQAFARLAVLVVLFSTTTISTVPVTPAEVVNVIAIVVSLPAMLSTFFLTLRRRWGSVRWILALALFTTVFVLVFMLVTTAIATIPTTSAIIVPVVAIIIGAEGRR